jgi:hypothetical protein
MARKKKVPTRTAEEQAEHLAYALNIVSQPALESAGKTSRAFRDLIEKYHCTRSQASYTVSKVKAILRARGETFRQSPDETLSELDSELSVMIARFLKAFEEGDHKLGGDLLEAFRMRTYLRTGKYPKPGETLIVFDRPTMISGGASPLDRRLTEASTEAVLKLLDYVEDSGSDGDGDTEDAEFVEISTRADK